VLLTHATRAAMFVCLLWLCGASSSAPGQDGPPQSSIERRDESAQPGDHWGLRGRGTRPDPGPTKRGLLLSTDAAFAGYTLFAPLNSTTTYLVDMKGEVAHSWKSRYEPGQSVYLLDDGSLLRAARELHNRNFGGGGIGGRVERLAPDGTVLWEFVYADEDHCQHHDIEPLPDGNVLLIAWEKKTREEALVAGHDPDRITDAGIWPDCVIEVEPQGSSGGKIVWEWHVWDHLVQSFDQSKPNYGVVAQHPELIDLNYRRSAPRETPAEMRRLRALGYVGGDEPEEDENDADDRPPWGGPGGFDMQSDWCHTNAIAYNARLDQIALSVHTFNEIWIIDHSTTTEEAAGHVGGHCGKGGDLLYRWGNPRAYGAGDVEDQQLFAQHDVRWIPEGLPGAGHLMAFNNGMGRPDGQYSSVVEIAPPIEPSGRYTLQRGQPFAPARPRWEYTAEDKRDFFASHISGAERLPNGDTLVCSGESGRIFEVTTNGKIVWEYVNPYIESRRPEDNGGPPDAGWRPGRFRGPPDGDRPTSRPGVRRRPFPPGGRPGGRWGRPGGRPGDPWGQPGGGPGSPWGPPGGGPIGGGLFRATRLALDHPGVRHVLEAGPAK
jgi:hypothetical protein